MASLSTSALANVLLSMTMAERIRSQINRRCVLLNLLPTRIGADPLSWTVKFSGRTQATGVSQTAAAPTATQDIKEKATLNMGEYADTASVTGRAESAAAMALNPLGVAGGNSLMLDELRDSANNIATAIANDIYAGDGTTANPIVGLATAIDSTGTYAGLAQGTYSEWASIEGTGALADISFEMIREFLTDIEDWSGERPDFAVAPTNVVDKIRGLFSSYDAYVKRVNIGGREIMLSGTSAVEVEGITVVGDPRCTANTLYALNSDHIDLSVMPHKDLSAAAADPDVVAAEFLRLTGDPMTADEAAALIGVALNGGIIPYIKDLGATGNQTSKELFCYPQVRVTGRKYHGKFLFT